MKAMTKKEIVSMFATENFASVEDVKQALIMALPQCSEKQYNTLYERYYNAYSMLSGKHKNMYGKLYKQTTLMPAEVYATLVKATLDKCKGVALSILGQKLVASGNTKANKETLSQLGYKYNHKNYTWEWYTVSADYVLPNMSKVACN